ncbi:MAG TPA: VanZ family protein, partial [Methylomirabilota bacterium]|nr:VanZ family protein [Methylomirabilota bacterium]
MARLAWWLPPLAWMGAILWAASDDWSAERTAEAFTPLLRWLLPTASAAHLAVLHVLARKTGHLAAYALLAALWRRALVGDLRLSPRLAAGVALAVALGWAALDEWRQAAVAARTGTALDVLLDGAGAVAGLALARRGGRWAVPALTRALLWVAVAGGGALLVIAVAAGAPAGALWVSVPAAAVLLVVL